jgi:hypothetical protein
MKIFSNYFTIGFSVIYHHAKFDLQTKGMFRSMPDSPQPNLRHITLY